MYEIHIFIIHYFSPHTKLYIVDDGSFLHNTAEPRFLGGHIPSKAFKTLQTTLPSESAGSSSTAPPARTTSKRI